MKPPVVRQLVRDVRQRGRGVGQARQDEVAFSKVPANPLGRRAGTDDSRDGMLLVVPAEAAVVEAEHAPHPAQQLFRHTGRKILRGDGEVVASRRIAVEGEVPSEDEVDVDIGPAGDDMPAVPRPCGAAVRHEHEIPGSDADVEVVREVQFTDGGVDRIPEVVEAELEIFLFRFVERREVAVVLHRHAYLRPARQRLRQWNDDGRRAGSLLEAERTAAVTRDATRREGAGVEEQPRFSLPVPPGDVVGAHSRGEMRRAARLAG